MKVLKELFSEGLLDAVMISPVPMKIGHWSLSVRKINGSTVALTKNRTRLDKEYKRITAALADARRIGFRKIIIEDYELATKRQE